MLSFTRSTCEIVCVLRAANQAFAWVNLASRGTSSILSKNKLMSMTKKVIDKNCPKTKGHSHTRLKAHDHCNLRALMHWSKGRTPSKFTSHTKVKAWRPKEDFMNEKFTWSPTWRTTDKVSWSPKNLRPTHLHEIGLTQIPGDHDYFFDIFSSMTYFKTDYSANSEIDSRIDKHHQIISLSW